MDAAETEVDEQWMRQALQSAVEAEARGEVPVGTCIVRNGELIAVAGNRTRTDCDPTAHAELPPRRCRDLLHHRALRHVCRRVDSS